MNPFWALEGGVIFPQLRARKVNDNTGADADLGFSRGG